MPRCRAFLKAVDESPEQYRKDQAALAAAASSSVRGPAFLAAARRCPCAPRNQSLAPPPAPAPQAASPAPAPWSAPRARARRTPFPAAAVAPSSPDRRALFFFRSAQGGVDGLLSMEPLSALKARAAAGTLVYSKFVGIGLFRLLELTGATEPAALARLADASGAPLAKVNADLTLYKGLLSKLAAAKECVPLLRFCSSLCTHAGGAIAFASRLMAEYLAREAKKTAQRMAEKEAKASGSSEGTSASPA